MTLTACASAPPITPQVVIPPPSTPGAEFFLDKVQVQSRETGADAWQRNDDYARALGDALKEALRVREKALAPPPADHIRAKLYIAYAPAPATAKGAKRASARVEVRLELVESAGGAVRYSTLTETPISASLLSKVGWAPEADQLIRDVLKKAADDFVSRL